MVPLRAKLRHLIVFVKTLLVSDWTVERNMDPSATGCSSLEDCQACTALDCVWTGRAYRACETALLDMEEVPVVLVRNQSDCPSNLGNLTTEISGGETEGVGNFPWIPVVAFLLATCFFVCFIFRKKVFKGKKTESMMELNDFGS